MTYQVVSGTLAATVAPASTFTVSYPAGKNPGSYYLSMAHKIAIDGNMQYFPKDFTLTFGASSITVTNATTNTYTWPQDASFRLQLEEPGQRSQMDYPLQFPNSQTDTIGGSSYSIDVRPKIFASTSEGWADLINLGAPITLDDDGICAAQSVAAAGALLLNGALVSGGAVTLDVPRALQIVSSNTDAAVLTVLGTDVYGRPMSEAITLNATTVVNGKKAFKTISSVTASAAVANLAKVGTTDILGLPVFMPAAGFIVGEIVNGMPVGSGGATQVQFYINATDLSVGTAQELISPVAGVIGRFTTTVQSAVTTGGNLKVQVGTADVVGLSIDVADAAAAGTVQSDTPTTPGSSTTLVSVGSRLRVVVGSTFATAGAINGFIEVQGTNGTVVPGIRTTGGSTTTTGDVRGTYTPFTACNGSNCYQLLQWTTQRYPGVAQNIAGA